MTNSVGVALVTATLIAFSAPERAAARQSQLLARLGGAGTPAVERPRVTLRVGSARRRVCYDLGGIERSGFAEAVIRSRRRGRRHVDPVSLFSPARPGPLDKTRRCVRGQRRSLRSIARAPHAFARSALNGTLALTWGTSYQGAWAARAANAGGGNQFQRVWYDTNWRLGDSVWYGMALFVPRVQDWCWWAPIRWDDWTARTGPRSHVGGVTIESGLLKVKYGSYREQRTLVEPVPVPESRWFWLEVHQRLSRRHRRALTELYIDGVRVGRSSRPNTTTNEVDRIRFGNVAMASACSSQSAVYFDRVSYSGSRLGPLP